MCSQHTETINNCMRPAPRTIRECDCDTCPPCSRYFRIQLRMRNMKRSHLRHFWAANLEYNNEIIKEKGVLTPQDYTDGTCFSFSMKLVYFALNRLFSRNLEGQHNKVLLFYLTCRIWIRRNNVWNCRAHHNVNTYLNKVYAINTSLPPSLFSSLYAMNWRPARFLFC